jgi:hypothetical protein
MNWKNQALQLIENFDKKAKATNRFVDLEDMAVNIGDEIKNVLLQGALSDKGDGRDIPLPEEMTVTANKPKNKGPKKNS